MIAPVIDIDPAAGSPAAASPGDPALVPGTGEPGGQSPQGRAMISVDLLTAHPGNVRHDLDLDPEFLASIEELGILTPLRITPDGTTCRVIEGHRRLAAAIRLGLKEVPYDLASDRDGDEAGQYLDMYTANHHRKDLTPLEEAQALFAASQAGASKTRIRKATGLGKDQVAAGLAAGKLTGHARETAEALGYAATLDQLALLEEFSDDPAAVDRITAAICNGSSGEHTAEQIRRERAEAAQHQQLIAALEGEGYAVSAELPAGACLLAFLLHDEQDLTPDTHGACPGRGVFFRHYDLLTPVHYCTDPDGNGHTSRYQHAPLPDLGPRHQQPGSAEPGVGCGADPGRRIVVEGNRAWITAGTVRTRWLAGLLRRRTAPKETMRFIATQILTRPGPVRDALTRSPGTDLFHELAGGSPSAAEVQTWPTGRLTLLLLATVATAYESQMGGDTGKPTWRTDRYSPCSRSDAGVYLTFLASIGYELSPIEQAVADGTPYTGSEPDSDDDASALRIAASGEQDEAGQTEDTQIAA